MFDAAAGSWEFSAHSITHILLMRDTSTVDVRNGRPLFRRNYMLCFLGAKGKSSRHRNHEINVKDR